MIGKRIRQARLMSRLTLEEVAYKLSRMGKSISKQSLSNYEKNKRTPAASTLLQLSKVLEVKPSYFLHTHEIEIEWSAYRAHRSLRQKDRNSIAAHALDSAEKYLYLLNTIIHDFVSDFPDPVPVNTTEEAEDTARKLRERWDLGQDPIENLTFIIEKKGGIVSLFQSESIKFDGLSGCINGQIPIIVINSNVPTDRRRFNLAHELGHLVLDCSGVEAKSEERIANRFAGAFLAPSDTIKKDFVTKRRRVSWQEIGLMKKRYGLSMQASIFRLRDLGIINEATYTQYCREFNWRKWRRKEPVEYEGDETPTRLRQMILYALSEGIITQEKADELCPGCTSDFESPAVTELKMQISPKELMTLPIKKRRELLRDAAAIAESEYGTNQELTDFEAFDEDDFYG